MSVPTTNWWNPSFTYRQKLKVTSVDAISEGYALQFRVTSTAAAAIYNLSQTTGNDVRVVYWTGFKWVELNRHLVTFSASEVDIWFKLQDDLEAAATDDNYYLYFGNSSPFTEPGNPKSRYCTFTGLDEYIGIPYNVAFAPTSAITFECWAYRDNWTAYTVDSRLLSKTEAGGYMLGLNEATMGVDYVGVLVRRNGAYGVAKVARSTITDGWHHFAGTYDGRYTKFYVDGVLVSTDDAGGSYAIQYSASNSLIIGAEAGATTTPTGNYFEGYIDEVRIWNIAKGQSQIAYEKDCEIPSSSTGLVGYWKLNNGSGTTATDEKAVQNGTLTNDVGWFTTDRVPNDLSQVYTYVSDFEDNTFMQFDTHDAGWSIQGTTVKEGTYAAQSTTASIQALTKNDINQISSAYEGWFRFAESNKMHFPFINGGNLSATAYNLYWIVAYSDAHWKYNIGGGYTNFPTDTTYSATTWYYVRLIYNNATNTFRVWVGTDPNSLTELTTSAGLDAKDSSGNINTLIKYWTMLNTNSSGSGQMWIDTARVRPWTPNIPTVVGYSEPEQTATAKGKILNTNTKLMDTKAYISPPASLITALASTVRTVRGKVEIKWDGISWADESQYLISATGNFALSGPLGESSAGEMDIELDNTTGRFDPANTLSPIYADLRPKIEVKVSADFEDVGYYTQIFYGMTRSIDPNFRTAITSIHCFDKTKQIMGKKASTAVLVNKRLDEVFVALAQEAGLSSTEYNADITEGSIHGAWFNNQDIWEMMGQLAVAERGRIFFDEKGILRLWSRNRLRMRSALPTNLSMTTWLLDLNYEISDTSITNDITVTAKPRASAGIQQVWSNGDIEALDPYTDTLVYVPAKSSQYAYIELDDPAIDWIEPIAYSDYTANTEVDGTGNDLTSSIRVSDFTPYDNAAFLIVNNDSTQGAYLTKFTLRANPIKVYKWIKIEASDETSIDLYGQKTSEFENDFIDDEATAQSLAVEELARWKNAKNSFTAKILGIPYFKCGDLVNIEIKSGTYGVYMITSIDWDLDQQGFLQTLGLVNPITYPITKSLTARANILATTKTVSAKGFVNIIG